MREWQSQSHVRWSCRYHLVFVPKYRKKSIFGDLRRDIGKVLRELCQQHGVELLGGHAMADHVHLCLSIPPKFSVANTAGFEGEIGDPQTKRSGKSNYRCGAFRLLPTVEAPWEGPSSNRPLSGR